MPGMIRYAGPKERLSHEKARREIKRETPVAVYNPLAGLAELATVPAPPSIVELARALKHDVDLIYEWVYSNVDYHCMWGVHKGALGTLIDRFGGPIEQAVLMLTLLTESGYTATLMKGSIRLTKEQIDAFLGSQDTEDVQPSKDILDVAHISYTAYPEEGLFDYLDMEHIWVRVTIDGTDYVFDPSYKAYDYADGIDLAEAIQWVDTDNQSYDALRAAAMEGASTESGIQNLNRGNIHSYFKTYGTNLLNWINTNKFDASVIDIIGGREIHSLTSQPVRQTSLPYQTPGVDPAPYTIQSTDRATYRVQFGGIDQTFYTDDIYGKRLTIQVNSSVQPELRLEGQLIATGTAQAENTWVNVTLTIHHPFADTSADQTLTQGIYTNIGSLSFLGTVFGPISQSMVDHHRQVLQQNRANGGGDSDENVLGESLAVYYYMHAAQGNKISDIVAAKRLSNCCMQGFHGLGQCAYNSYYFQGPHFDLNFLTGVTSLVGDSSQASNAFAILTSYGSALEGGIFQQCLPTTGISAIKLLDAACAAGQSMYSAGLLNWNRIRRILQQNNWDAGAINAMDYDINWGEGAVVVHQNGQTTVQNFVGGGFLYFSVFVGIGDSITGHLTAGGSPGNSQTPGQTNDGASNAPDSTTTGDQGNDSAPKTCLPVALFSGNHLYERSDITVGSGVFPYALEFIRYHDTGSRLVDGPLGLGWTHNFAVSISNGSNGLRAAGEISPKETAATIAHSFVLLKLSLGISYPTFIDLLNVLINIVSSQWLMDEIFTNNAATVTDSGASRTFIKLVDGGYNPPPGYACVLTKNIDGTFTLKNPQLLTRNFNTAGNLSTYVDPAGVTVTYTYDGSNRLTSISNGLTRTLTFTYSGSRLASVSDGNGRSVSFAIDANSNLTEFTDANGKTTTYAYEVPGQLTQYFLPANPSVAFVTNTYDFLGRVMTQTPANQGTSQYYFSGSRSEVVDPLGNSHVMYYNSLGSLLRDINALGQETTYERDGLNRLVSTTYPELNVLALTYDNKNNVLRKTWQPKPGSGLSDVVHIFTYDPTWNKVVTFTDGLDNTTSFRYDATQGTMLTITRPAIDGQTPTVAFTYNARGQALTRTDETGIVDSFVYDSTTQKLISATRDFGTGRLNLVTSYAHDNVGNVTSITDPRGNATRFQCDNERRLTQKTDSSPFGYVTTWQYNLNGWCTSVKRQTGDPASPYQTWTYTYLVNGMLATIADPAGSPLNFQYDTLARLTTRMDAAGRVWQFAYDPLRRISTVTDPMMNIADTRTYTNNGMLASREDARSNTTTYQYDGFDRLSQQIYPDSTFEQYTHDANYNLLTLLTRKGDTITNTYDVLTRIATRQPGSLALQRMTYDLAGRPTSVSTPVDSGDPASGNYGFSYDTAGRLVEQTMPDGKSVAYQLDANDNRTSLTYPDNYYAEYVYDELNRLTDIKLNGSTSAAVHFDYDQLSRRTAITYENGCQTSYSYELNDDMSSLAQSFVGSAVNFQFCYNQVHQVTGMSCSNSEYVWSPPASRTTFYSGANNLNQYPTVGADSYSYNPNGCLAEGLITASYDELNRMTQAVCGSVTNDYWYDPFNRQAQKAVDNHNTSYLYDGQQLIAEYNISGPLINRYVRGNRLDEVFIKVTAAEKTYFHHDRLGSVIAQTDDAGAVLVTYKCGPFGETASLTGTPFGYTGQRYDAEIGLYNYKARYYAPAIGRFLQPDPIGTAGGMNLYSYVRNDAVNLADSMGFQAVCPNQRLRELWDVLNELLGLAPDQFPNLKAALDYFAKNPLLITAIDDPRVNATEYNFERQMWEVKVAPNGFLSSTAPLDYGNIFTPLDALAHELGHAYALAANKTLSGNVYGITPKYSSENYAFLLQNEVRLYYGYSPRIGYGSASPTAPIPFYEILVRPVVPTSPNIPGWGQ
jgi:RHS repeat-associated protein